MKCWNLGCTGSSFLSDEGSSESTFPRMVPLLYQGQHFIMLVETTWGSEALIQHIVNNWCASKHWIYICTHDQNVQILLVGDLLSQGGFISQLHYQSNNSFPHTLQQLWTNSRLFTISVCWHGDHCQLTFLTSLTFTQRRQKSTRRWSCTNPSQTSMSPALENPTVLLRHTEDEYFTMYKLQRLKLQCSGNKLRMTETFCFLINLEKFTGMTKPGL